MKRNFLTLKQFLEENYPESLGNIHGENFPPPPYTSLISNLLSMVQMFAMAAAFLGDGIWSFVPFVSGPPSWFKTAKENSVMTMMFIFLIVPTFVNSLIISGAFEIELDGVLVYSKIQTGKMPSGMDIIDAFTKAGLQRMS
mmetsp:Transcript_41868/g.61470  ORF Transcript_41868/g.61470 Transcript_41868/m.61470 type:complete len:141 (+) Transcript_41868:301-723(+)